MSEAMAIESLLLANWRLHGFFGEARVRIPCAAGPWKEIDVLAFRHIEDGTAWIRAGEVKIRGEANNIYVLNPEADVLGWVAEWEWGNFVEAIGALYPHGNTCTVDGFPNWTSVSLLEVEFVVNGVFERDHKEATCLAFQEKVRERLRQTWNYRQKNPASMEKVRVSLRTSLDLIADTMARVREQTLNRGARFGDPVLDVFRELARYTSNPRFNGILKGEAAKSEYTRSITEVLSTAFAVGQPEADSLKSEGLLVDGA